MAKILSRYADTKDISRVEYTSEKEYLKKLTQKKNIQEPDDLRTPFSFKEWQERNIGLIPGSGFDQYNTYLKNWYDGKYTPEDNNRNIKEDYINLLKSISLTFQDDGDFELFKDVDFSNDLEIKEAIPLFTKKLKEIAIYLINKRNSIKRAKLKYNMSGATNALERLFYEYLLKAFTKRDYVLNVPEQTGWNAFPDLSAVNCGFQIKIQELYDDTSYFDKDPRMPIGSYFNLTSTDLTSYLNDYDYSDIEWLFQTGIYGVTGGNPLFWTLSNITINALSSYEQFDFNRPNALNEYELAKKYLGEKQYFVSGGYFITDEDEYSYNLQAGNNWFYWPSGEFFTEVPEKEYNSIHINNTELINIESVASKDYRDADKLFVLSDNVLSAAWLKTESNKTFTKTMSALIQQNGEVYFRFPYPGYGISGEDISWSGKELNNFDPVYTYLSDEVKRGIDQLYWNTNTGISAICSISIHESSLIDNNAHSAEFYEDADKLEIRTATNSDIIHDSEPDSVYKDGFNYSWLYSFNKTDIPIIVGQNFIHCPVYKYDPNDPNSLLFNIPEGQMPNVPLSSLNTNEYCVGARAGYGLADSDIIYKLNAFNGEPVECAYLSGTNIDTLVPGSSGKFQPNFTLYCTPGKYETFIWQDDNVNVNDTTIRFKQHQKDCSYLELDNNSIYDSRILKDIDADGVGQWQKCDCKSILYSPLGHKGNRYEDYSGFADVIVKDDDYPNTFDLLDDNITYAWYKLDSTDSNVDVGWGKGQWVTNDGSNFILEEGKLYHYLRSNIGRNNTDVLNDKVAPLIIKQKFNSAKQTQWMKAIADSNGNWEATDNISDMVLRTNDFIMYDHIDSCWYCLTAVGDKGITYVTPALTANPETNYWISNAYPATGTVINIYWPSILYDDGPEFTSTSFNTIEWDILRPNGSRYTTSSPGGANLSLLVEETGVYTITAVGVFFDDTTYDYTDIPMVTGVDAPDLVPVISGTELKATFYNNRINYTMNIPVLSGKPFWAKAYDDFDDNKNQTKYKGVNVYGGGITTPYDNYTFITQPDISDAIIDHNSIIKYKHEGDGFVWAQEFDYISDNTVKRWNKLLVEYDQTSPLSSYLYNISSELIISATDIESDIILKTNDYINYWANNAFTWNQTLTAATEKWITPVSGIYVDPIVPYANLTNRHFPTVASQPNIAELYSREDSGGFMIPNNLGINIYYAKNFTNSLNTLDISNNPSDRGLDVIFNDINVYNSDFGLTEKTQVMPISTLITNSEWQKAAVNAGQKAGDIVNADKYQNFIPYQTNYETYKDNKVGLSLQSDVYDPWYGSEDNTWQDTVNYPANFRNEYDILKWYDDHNLTEINNKFIYQWKTDIFGNQYFLLKDDSLTTYYDKQISFGELWTRDQLGKRSSASESLSSIYDIFANYSLSISADIVNSNIRDFDIWFDTLMLETTGNLLIEKIQFDYDDNYIFSSSDDIHVIDLSGGYHSGTWLFEEDKEVVICNAIFENNIIYPILYKLDLDTNKLDYIYNGSANTYITSMSALGFTNIEQPVFTYNDLTKEFNMTCIGFTSTNNSMFVVNTVIKYLNNNFDIKDVNIIIPN